MQNERLNRTRRHIRTAPRLGRFFALLVLLALAPLQARAQEGADDGAAIPAYTGSQACSACHGEVTDAWEGSQHALAWTDPAPDTVLGDFSGSEFTHRGVTTRFFRDGARYMVETQGGKGEKTRFVVAGVAGVAPLQQYLLDTGAGRLQSFDVVWDVERRTWYHLYPDQDLPPEDALHWTGPYKNWNARCAECHATGFEKNYDPQQKAYQSTQAEKGVGCEACHGPAQAHLQWAEKGARFSPSDWSGVNAIGLTIDLSQPGRSAPAGRLRNPETQIQQCAGCHSRREPFSGGSPLPGMPFHDAYRLSTLRPGLYHPDGQIRDEVYVYGSFLQSRMYARGVGCTNCHNPHTAELRAEGNALCAQCHSPAGNPDFPTLEPKEYDNPAHSFHPAGSPGAQCKSCHMIERVYMGVDGRRDHSFRIPRPDLSLQTGTPNACNDCHRDKTAKWAAGAVAQWYPDSPNRGPHFVQVLAPARMAPQRRARELAELAEYTTLPAIARATALEMLAPVADAQMATRLEPLLSDADPLVRAAAIAVQRAAPETERSARIVTLLGDPVRAVRIAAARGFLGMRIAYLPERMNRDLDRAMADWRASLAAKADFPETQMVLAGIGLTTRRMDAALAAFGDAVEMDPQLVRAWIMMVRIHLALGDRAAAIKTLDAALARNPEDVQLNLMRADLAQ